MISSDNTRSQGTTELETRRRLNNSGGKLDLDALVHRRLNLSAGSRLLELGAGTGGHLLAEDAQTRQLELCAVLDVSQTSLDLLERRARERGVVVTSYHADMDRLVDPSFAPELDSLTHVCAVYALYYSRDARALLSSLTRRLSPRASVLVVGPAPGNNREWYRLLVEGGAVVPKSILAVSETFFAEHVEPAGRTCFDHFNVSYETNAIAFESAEALEQYWRSNIYFDTAADAGVSRAIRAHFARSTSFTITKRILCCSMSGPR